MGLKCAQDFAQKVMEEVLCNVKATSVYLENIGTFSFTWENNILLLEKSITLVGSQQRHRQSAQM